MRAHPQGWPSFLGHLLFRDQSEGALPSVVMGGFKRMIFKSRSHTLCYLMQLRVKEKSKERDGNTDAEKETETKRHIHVGVPTRVVETLAHRERDKHTKEAEN